MTNDDPFGVGVELGQSRGNVSHRNVNRVRERCDRDLFGLADVEHDQLVAARAAGLQFSGLNFTNFRHFSYYFR